jgi:hypothetical protein
MLREVQQLALTRGTDTLAQCETDLTQAATVLVELRESLQQAKLPRGNAELRQELLQVRQAAARLKAQFDHGSNYCMGLLQAWIGTGYSAQGRPVLIPSESKSSFEG